MSKIIIATEIGNPKNEVARGELGTTVVQADGGYYFDISVVYPGMLKLKGAGQQYTCPIKKGTCNYYNLISSVTGELYIDEVGWIYPIVENPNFKNIEGKIAFYAHKLDIKELTE